MSDTSVATSQISLPASSTYSNLITAEIRVENLSTSNVEQSGSSTISIPTSSSSNDVVGGSSSSSCLEEPEKKRQKLDVNHPLKVKRMEKLENRLGGILCCAVCLDLPRSAMYQVSDIISAINCQHFSPKNIVASFLYCVIISNMGYVTDEFLSILFSFKNINKCIFGQVVSFRSAHFLFFEFTLCVSVVSVSIEVERK